jgi:diacylglycerol kinase (ATP)
LKTIFDYFGFMKSYFAVFINPFANNSKTQLIQKETLSFLKAKGVSFKVFGKEYPDLSELFEFTDCIVIGGDGTLNFMLNKFPDIQLPVSIITSGTGNDFARKLYGTKNLQEQLEIALHGALKMVDVGMCNGRLFHNGVGVGFDGNVVFNMLKKKYFTGKLAYYAQVIPLVFSYTENDISIIVNGVERKEKSLIATVANGSYFGGGFQLTPLADLYDGLLDVCLVKDLPVWKRIFNLPLIEKGKHLELSFVDYFKTNEIKINSANPLHAHIDGEYFCADSFEITLKAGKALFRS